MHRVKWNLEGEMAAARSNCLTSGLYDLHLQRCLKSIMYDSDTTGVPVCSGTPFVADDVLTRGLEVLMLEWKPFQSQ